MSHLSGTHIIIHVQCHAYQDVICVIVIRDVVLLVCSQLSVLSDGMEAIDEHVNATDIDQVVEHLRYC